MRSRDAVGAYVLEERIGSGGFGDVFRARHAVLGTEVHPRYRLVVEGHTDGIGSETYNAGLATRRARAVRDEIVAQGIQPDRVVAVIYGEAEPPARDPRAAANRVFVMYSMTTAPQEVAARTLVPGLAVLWP